MNKKPVQIVGHRRLNFMGKIRKRNNVFGVGYVQEHLFGRDLTTKDLERNIGSNCGLKRVTASGK
jgi:hypothetical protein